MRKSPAQKLTIVTNDAVSAAGVYYAPERINDQTNLALARGRRDVFLCGARSVCPSSPSPSKRAFPALSRAGRRTSAQAGGDGAAPLRSKEEERVGRATGRSGD